MGRTQDVKKQMKKTQEEKTGNASLILPCSSMAAPDSCKLTRPKQLSDDQHSSIDNYQTIDICC